mmetsp:Transcript_9746/g.27866  ORF Transcript_9746/g.27866 Transcript_9746/m.27866 type:complete len:524 (-) Transcript_9746:59-1630(-)
MNGMSLFGALFGASATAPAKERNGDTLFSSSNKYRRAPTGAVATVQSEGLAVSQGGSKREKAKGKTQQQQQEEEMKPGGKKEEKKIEETGARKEKKKEKKKKRKSNAEAERAWDGEEAVTGRRGGKEDARKQGVKKMRRGDQEESDVDVKEEPMGEEEVAAMDKQQGGPDKEGARGNLERTLFVGNIPLTISRKVLKQHFSRFGKVLSVRIRSLPVKLDSKMPRKAATITGTTAEARSSANAYVEMETEEAATAALTLNMTVLQGKHIRVDRATAPGSNRPTGSSGAGEYDPARTVFLGNLHFEVENEEIIEAFEAAAEAKEDLRGAIEAVRVVRDKENSVCKGFGFVLFKSKAAARAALSVKGTDVHGRELRVTRLNAAARRPAAVAGKLTGAKGRLGVRLFAGAGGKANAKAVAWQGGRVKAAGAAKKGSKRMRSDAGALVPARGGGGPQKKAKGKGKGSKGGDGGIPRAKGKRAAVATKKSKQLAAKARVAAGPSRKPKRPGSASPATKGGSSRKRKARG